MPGVIVNVSNHVRARPFGVAVTGTDPDQSGTRSTGGSMCQRHPWGRDATAPGHRAARAGQLARARENREYVRALLRKKQPEFAAALELVCRELSESARPVRHS
jgi:hypothetical protein